MNFQISRWQRFKWAIHTFFCGLRGHRRYLDNVGGVVYEVCECCPWVGRYAELPTEGNRVVSDSSS